MRLVETIRNRFLLSLKGAYLVSVDFNGSGKGYTYATNKLIVTGDKVIVPIGKGNHLSKATVIATNVKTDGKHRIKEVATKYVA